MNDGQKKVLMVCLGNICRSPIAEGVFAKLVNDRGLDEKWYVDSAGLEAWHVGKPPQWRSKATMRKHKIPYFNKCRQIEKEDFYKFDFIFGMEEGNINALLKLAPQDSTAKISLLGEFDPNGERIIRDPFFDGDSAGYEKCYQQCIRACGAFLDQPL